MTTTYCPDDILVTLIAGVTLVTNILDRKSNATEYISSGGYFGTGAGAILAYPGAPRGIYVSIRVTF